MNNHRVIGDLLSAKFEYLGVIDDLEELDYFELIEDSWYLGIISSENLLLVINRSMSAWGLNCESESDWINTKILISSALIKS